MLEDRLVESLGKVRDDMREYLLKGDATSSQFEEGLTRTLEKYGLFEGLDERSKQHLAMHVNMDIKDKIPAVVAFGAQNTYVLMKEGPTKDSTLKDIELYNKILGDAKAYIDARFDPKTTTESDLKRYVDDFLEQNETIQELGKAAKMNFDVHINFMLKPKYRCTRDEIRYGNISFSDVSKALKKL